MPRIKHARKRPHARHSQARPARIVRRALDIEEPLTEAADFVCALRLIGHGMDDDEGRAIVATAWAASARLDALHAAWLAMLKAAKRSA